MSDETNGFVIIQAIVTIQGYDITKIETKIEQITGVILEKR